MRYAQEVARCTHKIFILKVHGSTKLVIYYILCLFNSPLYLAIANSSLDMGGYKCKLIINSRNQGHTQDFILVMVVVVVGGGREKTLGSQLLQTIFLEGVTNVI
jgi:hypothetical protein